MNSDCSVWKFQASFALKGAVYASATAWKDMKGCYPMRNLNKTLAKCYVYEVTVKEEESEGCNIKSVPEYFKCYLSIVIFSTSYI